ncbi:MAG: hypothetical protein K2K75_07260 [Muribaculaceae bacterium]|nr:hypothetical protein [Muribaculaceae bacterium]
MRTIRIKQLLAAVFLTACAVLLAPKATASLQIYKVKGEVTVKSNAKTVKAQRRATVVADDVLTIPADGSVDILDSETHRIYSSTQTGKMSVKSLMKKAESQAANITRNINRKVISAVADNATQKRSGYDAMGMAIHETDAVVPTLINIPDSMSYLTYLLANPTEDDSAHQSFISLACRQIETEDDNTDGAFNFVLHNSTAQPLYFNIVAKDEEKGLRLFFRRNPIASPKSDTAVEEYIYIPDNDTEKYVAIASDHNFSLKDVKHLLNDDYTPKDTYYLTILTINN